MTCIIHISGDYPDTIQRSKTRAIANLVDATAGTFDHRVYSLNRANTRQGWLSPGLTETISREPGLVTLRYHAPKWGLFLARAMERVAAAIEADLAAQGIRPDLVHGHKLSIEGLAARSLAKRLGIPFVVSLQGNTDAKVIGARPDLKSRFTSVWQDAAHVFAFAPWIERWCRRELGPRSGPTTPLPCILASEQVIAPSPTEACVSTAFNLDFWENKNIDGLLRAVAIVRRAFPDIRLKIAGWGSEAAVAKVTALVTQAGLADITSMDGQVAPERIQEWMNASTVFALPSHRETFGMVFVEALLAGAPIVYPAGAAVDGYFDDAPFAISARSRDSASIADAITRALKDNAGMKQQLAAWQTSPAARPFLRAAIAESYCAAIKRVIA